MTLSNNHATLSQADLVACSNGVQANGTFTELELDPVGGNILIHTTWDLFNNGCASAGAPAGQSSPATIFYDYLPPNDTSSNLVAINGPIILDIIAPSVSLDSSQCLTFQAFGTNSVNSSISIQCNGTGTTGLALYFLFPSGTAPATGAYSTQTLSLTTPAATIEYNTGNDGNTSAGHNGYLNVTNLQFDMSGNVSSFAAEFVIFDNSSSNYPPTYGTARYNSPP